MKPLQNQLKWIALTAYLVLPSISYSAPGTLSDSPLWLGASVKHNLMLMIDDSGSMDFEVLFNNNDGALYLNNNGFFCRQYRYFICKRQKICLFIPEWV
jgi:type IV pilus assembly protein PilY1